jgi:hypothetical protein
MSLMVVLRYLWASPNTIIGLALACISYPGSTSAKWSAGALEMTGGLIGSLMAKWPFRASAICIGHVILAHDEAALILSRRHERVHMRQYETFGPFMLPAYCAASAWALIRGGRPYHDNYFERQARR